jgi:hypothetical protein
MKRSSPVVILWLLLLVAAVLLLWVGKKSEATASVSARGVMTAARIASPSGERSAEEAFLPLSSWSESDAAWAISAELSKPGSAL